MTQYRVQVAAQTGHSVWLVDVSQQLLDKAKAAISSSVQRVAKKTFAKDPKVREWLSVCVYTAC